MRMPCRCVHLPSSSTADHTLPHTYRPTEAVEPSGRTCSPPRSREGIGPDCRHPRPLPSNTNVFIQWWQLRGWSGDGPGANHVASTSSRSCPLRSSSASGRRGPSSVSGCAGCRHGGCSVALFRGAGMGAGTYRAPATPT